MATPFERIHHFQIFKNAITDGLIIYLLFCGSNIHMSICIRLRNLERPGEKLKLPSQTSNLNKLDIFCTKTIIDRENIELYWIEFQNVTTQRR